ncbi:hypothetical protein AIOL_001206 [Candidatus Rhodobacter oscarellae]|uniref:Uncharacterized protein n=1 Tax=Candidatus Rhodobacter oscarellae TaxID=1675527 RepID=A0A0J9E368_9RHOB|nr:hypothetical protein AIOL_001206 [Candidatus Rhodobacter lobularis]
MLDQIPNARGIGEALRSHRPHRGRRGLRAAPDAISALTIDSVRWLHRLGGL